METKTVIFEKKRYRVNSIKFNKEQFDKWRLSYESSRFFSWVSIVFFIFAVASLSDKASELLTKAENVFFCIITLYLYLSFTSNMTDKRSKIKKLLKEPR